MLCGKINQELYFLQDNTKEILDIKIKSYYLITPVNYSALMCNVTIDLLYILYKINQELYFFQDNTKKILDI